MPQRKTLPPALLRTRHDGQGQRHWRRITSVMARAQSNTTRCSSAARTTRPARTTWDRFDIVDLRPQRRRITPRYCASHESNGLCAQYTKHQRQVVGTVACNDRFPRRSSAVTIVCNDGAQRSKFPRHDQHRFIQCHDGQAQRHTAEPHPT